MFRTIKLAPGLLPFAAGIFFRFRLSLLHRWRDEWVIYVHKEDCAVPFDVEVSRGGIASKKAGVDDNAHGVLGLAATMIDRFVEDSSHHIEVLFALLQGFGIGAVLRNNQRAAGACTSSRISPSADWCAANPGKGVLRGFELFFRLRELRLRLCAVISYCPRYGLVRRRRRRSRRLGLRECYEGRKRYRRHGDDGFEISSHSFVFWCSFVLNH